MKYKIHKRFLGLIILFFVTILSVSWKVSVLNIFERLGLSEEAVGTRVELALLQHSFNQGGLTNLKSLVAGDRQGLVKDVFAYMKKYAESEDFAIKYQELRLATKPEAAQLASPEEMQNGMIKQLEKSVAEIEQSVKTASKDLKPVFKQVLDEARVSLEMWKDDQNELLVNYRNNYDSMLAMVSQGDQAAIKSWEADYPVHVEAYLVKQINYWLDVTDGVDFDAKLVVVKGKDKFANPVYEAKNNYWKMAFRGGGQAYQCAREEAAIWLSELSKH